MDSDEKKQENNDVEIRKKHITDYLNLDEFQLPYTTKWGLELQKINGNCPRCDAALSDLKGSLIEFSSCVEVKATGICHKCKLIVGCLPFRCYKDGRLMFYKKENGWIEQVPSHHGTWIFWILTLVASGILSVLAYYLF